MYSGMCEDNVSHARRWEDQARKYKSRALAMARGACVRACAWAHDTKNQLSVCVRAHVPRLAHLTIARRLAWDGVHLDGERVVRIDVLAVFAARNNSSTAGAGHTQYTTPRTRNPVVAHSLALCKFEKSSTPFIRTRFSTWRMRCEPALLLLPAKASLPISTSRSSARTSVAMRRPVRGVMRCFSIR